MMRLLILASVLVLVGVGLCRQRLSGARLTRLALLWTAIIVGLWLIASIVPKLH